MSVSQPRAFAPSAAGRNPARPSATIAWLRRLAPFGAVAALAYPVLVWPLLEAQVVSLEPVYGQPAIDGPPSALLRVYFSILLVSGVVTFAAQAATRPLGIRPPLLIALAALIAWAGVTGFWAVEPEISTRRFLLTVFIATGITCSTLAARDPDRVLRVAFWMFAAMAAISAWSVLATAPTALGHAAFYPHKNYFAAMTSMMILFALYQLTNGTTATRCAAVVMIALGIWFLAEARSKTCTALVVLVPLLSYGSVLLARHCRVSPAIALSLLALAIYGVYEFGAQSGFWDFHAVAETMFGDPTLTQRTDIWSFAIRKIAERPWLGYGYEVFWGAGANSPSVREGPGFVAQMPHAHNGYIDVVLQTGAVGLVLLAVLILSALHVAGRLARRSPGLAGFCLSMLIFGVLYNLLETAWFRSFGVEWMVVALVIAFLSQSEQPSRR